MAGLTTLTTVELLIRLNKEPVGGVIDLSSLDFREANFRHKEVRSKLVELTSITAKSPENKPLFIDFTNSNLSGRGFYDLDLTHTIMTGIIAERAVFTGSNLSDIQLDQANLNFADMRYTTLRFTKLHNTSIFGTNFIGADLTEALGMKFNSSDKEIIERLGQAGNIYDTKFPENVERIREDIHQEINKTHNRVKLKDPDNREVKSNDDDVW